MGCGAGSVVRCGVLTLVGTATLTCRRASTAVDEADLLGDRIGIMVRRVTLLPVVTVGLAVSHPSLCPLRTHDVCGLLP